MTKYFIYLDTRYNKKQKKHYHARRYYLKKLDKLPENLTYVGNAMLSRDYFIMGSETQYTDIIDLNSVEIQYTAILENGRKTFFSHTFQDLLERVKCGILPYISFKGHKVQGDCKLIINGKLHEVVDPLKLTLDIQD